MASYQIDCGYPTANQFLTAGHHATTGHPIVQSPLAATTLTSNSSSISPSPAAGAENSPTSSNSDSSVGTLTPDAVSPNTALGSSATVACGSLDNTTHPYALAGVLGSAIGGGGGVSASANTAPTPACCDNGRPMIIDPVTGQTVCSCQYDVASNSTRLSALGSYSRLTPATPVAGVGMSVFGSTYPSNDQNPYPSIAVETATPFYTSLNTPYALKDTTSSAAAWTSTALQPSSYYAYDPTFGACGYGASYDLASRRKNATRESTATLKAWLNEHMKNPYPTKGEKIMLAIITKMTLTQVSTWFANARRRLKKENKMTWEPKNRTEDEDAMVSDDEKDHDDDARLRPTASAAATSSSALAQQSSVMPTLKPRMEYDGHLSATGGNGAIGLSNHNHSNNPNNGSNNNATPSGGNNVANSVAGATTAGTTSTGVGVATDMTGNHHSIVGLNTQTKGDTYSNNDSYHLTLPQNLQQYSTNFYYSNTAAAAAAAMANQTYQQQHHHHHHHQQPTAMAAAAAAAVAATISPTTGIRPAPQLSYDNSSLIMPQHHSHPHPHHLLASASSAAYNMERR